MTDVPFGFGPHDREPDDKGSGDEPAGGGFGPGFDFPGNLFPGNLPPIAFDPAGVFTSVPQLGPALYAEARAVLEGYPD